MKKILPIYIVIILHVVGTVGSIIPSTSALTISLTPVNLLVSSALLLYQSSNSKKYIFLAAAFTIGMLIEIIGVKTGWPFGAYSYGSILGLKVMSVPLIIGINWFMLSYALGSIAHSIFRNNLLAITTGATFMVAMDIVIEPVAIKLGYWTWGNGEIPIANYIAWWTISLVILFIFNRLLKDEKNKVSIPLVLSQLTYFSAILLFS